MNIKNIHSVYFIGIGGIGMSALSRYMLHIGKNVAGYDKTASPITEMLEQLDIDVLLEDIIVSISSNFFNKENTLIVYTPAVKREENRILDYFLSNDFNIVKRAELLGIITKNSICLAVAGTHGKTTTSSILGHILKETKVDATSFLGGIAENYQSNLILGGNTYSVVEADEFDRSFLQLEPNIACITSIDADHLDIYENAEALVNTFKEFAALTTDKLFVRKGIPIDGLTYGINDNADYQAINIQIKNGTYIFDVKTPTETYKNIKVNLPGQHNVLNTMAALAMANSIGVSLQNIAKALLSYKGVHRRFSYRLKTENKILIDDYAHHPTEINAVYNAVSEMYPNEKALAIFQPHLYTRTRDFEAGFVNSLAQFDEVILLPIYPAREHPIKGISSDALIDKIRVINANVELVQPKELTKKITESDKKLIIMMGAGDIGELVSDVKKHLKLENV